MDDKWNEMHEEAEKLRDILDLPKSFFDELIKSDDWSFVVKLHALLETAVTWSLGIYLHPHPMQDYIATLDLSGSRNSKLELAKLFKIWERDDIRFVRGISKLRNRLVHNVRYIQFDLNKYVHGLEPNDRDDFLTNTCAVFDDPELLKVERTELRQRLLDNPKLYLWWSAIKALAFLLFRTEIALCRQENDLLKQKLLQKKADAAEGILNSLKSKNA